jgi:hypothetical protein
MQEGEQNEEQNEEQNNGEGEGQTQAKWYETLNPDLKANPSITKFNSVEDLGKSYVELQKSLGKDKVVLPTDKSTPEEWKAFYRKIGAPEKAEEYDVSDEDMPEQFRLDAAAKAEFRQKMHEAGLPKKHFEAAWKYYKDSTLRRINQETESIKNMRGSAETELRKEWGSAYEAKVGGAQKVINKFFEGKNIRPEFKVLANDLGFIKAMSEIAEGMSEDVIAGTARATLTPNEAVAELTKIIGDTKGPYYNELSPEHDAMVQRVIDLQAMAG